MLTTVPVYRGRMAAAANFVSIVRRASSSVNVTNPGSARFVCEQVIRGILAEE